VKLLAKVLVTGGAGFIGSNLVEELRSRNHDVHLCDIVHSLDSKSIRCDVSQYRQVDRVFAEQDFDFVYHAAAEYGRWNGEDHYENLWQTNAIGTKNILKAQKKRGFRMIFCGSAEVYGDYDGVMIEDVMERTPIRQMNDYAISKWANELQITNSALMHGTESVIIRLFNVYGPKELYSPYRGVVPVFIYRALNKLPYNVHRGHKRTFEYVDDICRTLGNVADYFVPGETYNLGSDKQYTIETLSDLVIKHTDGQESLVSYKEEEPFTTKYKVADSSKAKSQIDHNITIGLDEGIQLTVDWFKKKYDL
jgi:dTDP-glucose 4,6-dehydratase